MTDMHTDFFGQNSADLRGLADATLVVEKQQLPVHKATLAANSATLARMFKSSSGSTEHSSVIHLDDSLHEVCTALKVMYEGCSAFHATKLKSVEDVYCVTKLCTQV